MKKKLIAALTLCLIANPVAVVFADDSEAALFERVTKCFEVNENVVDALNAAQPEQRSDIYAKIASYRNDEVLPLIAAADATDDTFLRAKARTCEDGLLETAKFFMDQSA